VNHARVRSLLGDYMEGDLSTLEHTAVDEHIEGCPSCGQELRDLRTIVGLVRGLPDPRPPDGLADAVMARIAAGEGAPRMRGLAGGLRRVSQPRFAAALAAGVAGLLAWTLLPYLARRPEAPDRVDGQAIEIAAAPTPEIAAGDPVELQRRPVARQRSSAVPYLVGVEMPRRAAAFSGGVAPDTPDFDSDEIDRQLERLMIDPNAVLSRMGAGIGGEHFAQLAQHAARRGRAALLARSLIASSHPMANQLASRFLAASLAEDVQNRQVEPVADFR
jgi:anti-sigma factor RsiW